MKESLKIAIFHLGFFYSGGGEKLVLEEIRGLRSLGHEVTCFAPYIDRKDCFPDTQEMAEILPLLPPPPEWLPMKDPLWVTLSCLLIPFMAFRFRSYDVLLGTNQPGPWFAYVISKILGKPYVIYLAQPLRLLYPRKIDLENGIRIREGDHKFLMALKKLAGWFIDRADRLSVGNASVVLTNGSHIREWIQEVYGIDSVECPAGCHPIPERELNYGPRWRGEISVNCRDIPKPYILLTNRHSPMKRFEYALWALKEIRRSTKAVSLVITGQETEYTDQLRYLVEGLGLLDAVHFVGLVTEQDLATLYRSAAVYVYPSPEEDFGMGIVEAMASGTPVVAWNNGGPTVTVRDRLTGFLADPYDTGVFAEKLLTLSTNVALAERMGRAGHRRARQLFSYERHVRLLERLLFSAAGIIEREPVPVPMDGAINVLDAETDDMVLRVE
ncbi:MAG: glycosyltransferase family 4 protein [Chloroflexi bacterium]|nr:glycosyltransferase family 4 protein [Chloroflexota bacterium]